VGLDHLERYVQLFGSHSRRTRCWPGGRLPSCRRRLTLVANWRAIVAAKAAAQAAKTSARPRLHRYDCLPILDISVKSIQRITNGHSPCPLARGSLPAREVSFWVRGPSFVHHLSLPCWTSRRWTLLQLPVTSPQTCPAAEYACTAGRWEGVAIDSLDQPRRRLARTARED